VTQWLAIAPATQANPQHGGGVADFDRRYRGLDARGLWAWGPLQVHAGVALEQQTDDRRGHENFSGSGTTAALGVLGALRRAETNHASTRDAYAQAEWALGTDWLASAGLRSGQVRLRTQDQFLANGDDSGERRWRYTNPVLGLRWLAAPGWAWHASLGRGFESPTLGELAYRADGSGGFNSRLQAQTSRQWELGSKWRGAAAAGLPGPLEAEFTLFQARTDQEIGVATNSGGRSAFQNVGRTLRQGAELAAAWAPANGWNGRLALTWLDATYRDSFLTCAALPCTTPTAPVAAGARVAGTQRGSAWAEGGWRGASPWGRWHTAVEWRGVGRTAVNDRNSDFADAWHTTGLRAGATWATAGGGSLEALLRWENIFNRRYSGSVIVNDANGRFFEPGAPRHTQLVLRWVPPA
jgi:iron complex outermembrane receptor protein